MLLVPCGMHVIHVLHARFLGDGLLHQASLRGVEGDLGGEQLAEGVQD